MNSRTFIAYRVAQGLKDGDIVNLGIGIPTLVPKFISQDKKVVFQAENGIIGIAAATNPPTPNVFDAGGSSASVAPGGQLINSAESFGLIRSGKVDVTVLGALQVDSKGNLANWQIPGKMVVGYGGAMDLVTCAKKVIIAMEHTAKGTPKILEECEFPLTGVGCVSEIITELGVFEVTPTGLILTEMSSTTTLDEIKEKTKANYQVAEDLKINQIN